MTELLIALSEKGKIMLQDVFGLKIEGVVNVDKHNPSDSENPLLSSEENVTINGDKKTCNNVTDKTDDSSEASCLTISVYSAFVVALVITFLILGRDYVKYVLSSLEETDLWISLMVFTLLYTVVSFPMTWGYIVFNIATGYLYGLTLGLVTVMFCALTGLTIAHFVLKRFFGSYVKRKMSNDTVRAIIRVIESGHGMRVVILSRLTPIPFGLQNAIFAISDMPYPRYIMSSALGMAPTQGMQVYIGSTLRNMEEVMNAGSANSPTAYGLFIAQLLMVVVLLIYIIKRARKELNKTVHEYDPQVAPPAEVIVVKQS